MTQADIDQESKDLDIFYNIYFPTNKVFCDICRKDVTEYARLCTQHPSTGATLDICGICFESRLLTPNFQNTTTFSVVAKLDFPLFDKHWSAREELQLLEGLEKYGFGNWGDIAKHIGKGKSREECKRHFDVFFLGQVGRTPENVPVLTQKLDDRRLFDFSVMGDGSVSEESICVEKREGGKEENPRRSKR